MPNHADYEVDDATVQNVLSPMLSFLSSVLPPSIFSLISPLLTYSLALLAALFRFVYTLASAQEWDSQKVLPPLITLLMAYLALVSFYRTTGWMIRTAFWFVKWGGILAALAAGAGYFMGTAQGNGVEAFNGGVLSMLGSMLLGVLNEDHNARTSGRSRSARSADGSSPRTRKGKEKEKPKAWESWDKHRDWQYDADATARGGAENTGEHLQDAAQKMAGYVQEVLGTGWWEAVKNAVESSGLVGISGEEKTGGAQPKRKTKQDAKGRGNSR